MRNWNRENERRTKKLILECGGKEGDVTLLDCTNTEERGEEEEEGKKTCTLPTRGSWTQQWKESAGRVRNFPFCRRSGYLLLLLKLRQSSVRPSPSQHGASISLQGKVRTRVRTQKGRRIEGCDAHSFPHRERKNNNKRTRNERRNKQRKNTKHVGRKKNPLAVGRSFLKRRRYRLGHITFFFIDKYQ